ncbi:MAG: hypothetical protein NBV67_09845 [Tagaea sp.]|nr:hypothetical protein [Tagaea sp.]
MEGLAGIACKERRAAEQHVKDLEPMRVLALRRREQVGLGAGHTQQKGEIDFDEILGARPRALPIEPPMAAIGQHPPQDLAVRRDVGTVQVAENLSGRDLVSFALRRRLAVQRHAPGLVLRDRYAVAIARGVGGRILGFGARLRIGEKQQVGDVRATLRLGRALRDPAFARPVEGGENRIDDVVFGLGLVELARRLQAVKHFPAGRTERIELAVRHGGPIGVFNDSPPQIVLGE